MYDTVLQQLRHLKLTGMANALAMQLEQPGNYDELSVEQRLQLLTDAEQLDRDQRKQRRLLKAAKLKLHATGQDIDYHHPRGLQQAKMASLLHLHSPAFSCCPLRSIAHLSTCSPALLARPAHARHAA